MTPHAGRTLLGLVAAAMVCSAAGAREHSSSGSIDRQATAAPARRIVRTPGNMPPLPKPAAMTGSWPSFRGPNASGVADGQNLPDAWNGVTGENILWRTPIAGLGHSSAIVWGDLVFVTTAVSSRDAATFKPGLYGAGTPSEDRSPHRWLVYAIDRHTGKIAWERVAAQGVPVEKRHIKSTYASATPATDGRIVVAWFGSQGVYAYNMDGTLRWKVDLGHLDVGAYNALTLEWGTAASPIIWNDLVFLQCDTHTDSFMLALNASTGETVWKTDRDELPSWGTPTVVPTPAGPQLIANGSDHIRAYEPLTGREIWRFGPTSQITAPTPIFADQLIVVTSGRGPERPLYVVRPTAARGDVSLKAGASSNDAIVWSRTARGPYMPTPMIYKGVLYMLGNNGIFHAYTLATGEQIYETRVPMLGSGFSASMVGADGKIYVSGEDGDMFVLTAGKELKQLGANPMGEPLMATPALSRGVMYVRTPSNVFAIRQTDKPLAIPANAARVALPGPPTPADLAAQEPPMSITIMSPSKEHAAFVGYWVVADVPRMPNPIKVDLKLDAGRVTGEMTTAGPLKVEGTVTGNRIVFKVRSPNGERIVTFTGTVKGDEIAFERTVEVLPNGGTGGGGIFGVSGPSKFLASRGK